MPIATRKTINTQTEITISSDIVAGLIRNHFKVEKGTKILLRPLVRLDTYDAINIDETKMVSFHIESMKTEVEETEAVEPF